MNNKLKSYVLHFFYLTETEKKVYNIKSSLTIVLLPTIRNSLTCELRVRFCSGGEETGQARVTTVSKTL